VPPRSCCRCILDLTFSLATVVDWRVPRLQGTYTIDIEGQHVQAARKAASVDGAPIGRAPFPPCTLSSLQVEARLNTSDPHHSHILSLRLPFPHIFFSCSHTPYSSPPSISQLPCRDGVYSLAGQKSASLCHWLKATPVHSPSSLGSHPPRPLSCNMIPRAFGALVPCMPFIVNLTVR
jgi:hypothetical protein